MSESWFVKPSTTTLTLPGGQWIEVKNKLTVGEERAAFQAVVGEVNSEGWRRPNLEMAGLAEVCAYLVSWSLTDEGKPVSIDTDGKKVSAIRGLATDKYKLIEHAVQVHIAEREQKDAAEKNDQDGKNGPAPILPSAA